MTEMWMEEKVEIMLFSIPNHNAAHKPNPNRPTDGK